jgi:ribonuclease P protein component
MLEFPRLHRLTSQRDFQFVFAKPYKVSCQYLLALYRPNQLSHARLGVVIRKNLIHRAVDRNRVRRIVRESFRYHQEKLKGLDIIVVMRSQCTPGLHPTMKRNGARLIRGKKMLRDDIDRIWPQFAVS